MEERPFPARPTRVQHHVEREPGIERAGELAQLRVDVAAVLAAWGMGPSEVEFWLLLSWAHFPHKTRSVVWGNVILANYAEVMTVQRLWPTVA